MSNVKTLFNELKNKQEFKDDMQPNEAETINTHFPNLNIKDKIKFILECWDLNIIWGRELRDTLSAIDLEYYLISLIKQNEINQLLDYLCLLDVYDGKDISIFLKLWDIILKHSYTNETDNKQKQQELFLILSKYQVELTSTNIEEIKKIVNHMIGQKNYHDLLILLLILNVQFYEISNEEGNERQCYEISDDEGNEREFSDYLLSNLDSQDKKQLLSSMNELKEEEIEEIEGRYDTYEGDINTIKNSLLE